MNKTLLALTLILATAFADLADLNLASLGSVTLSAAGLYSLGTTPLGLIVNGGTAADKIGTHVSNAGDFNYDGYPDYVITGGSTTGKVFVILGKSSARTASIDLGDTSANLVTNKIQPITLTGTGATGLTVGAAGDMNIDGYDDIIIGCPACGSGNGAAWVVFGRTVTAAYTIAVGTAQTGEDADNTANTGYFYIADSAGASADALGTSVAAAGDIDGDGHDEVLISAPGALVSAAAVGKVWVVKAKQFTLALGTATTKVRKTLVDLNDIAGSNTLKDGYLISGESAAKQIGRYVAYAGDVNNDGRDDIIIGALDYAYIVYGVAREATTPFVSIPLATPASLALTTVITGTGTAGDKFGSNVGMAGDLNNDGADDVFIGAPGVSTNTGKVCIVWGTTTLTKVAAADCSTTTALGTKGIIFTGGATSDAFGTESDGVGDVNKDGIDDIVIGAPTSAGVTAGKVYVIYGSSGLSSLTVTSLTAASSGIVITGKTAGDYFGASVSGVGNINRDSSNIDDFIVGAPSATSTSTTTQTTGGLVYEFYGVKKTVVTTTTTGSGFRLGTSLLVLASFFVALIF